MGEMDEQDQFFGTFLYRRHTIAKSCIAHADGLLTSLDEYLKRDVVDGETVRAIVECVMIDVKNAKLLLD
jgi:hypothetical protein